MSVLGGDQQKQSFVGDGNPTLFNFSSVLTEQELLGLYITCPNLTKGVRWVPTRLLAAGWKFKKPEKWTGLKYGKDFEFESFEDWIHWNGLYEELINAMSWANLFRRSRIFFFLPEEKPKTYKGYPYYGKIERGTDICTKAKAMYSLINGNGWEIEKHEAKDLEEASIVLDEEEVIYKIHVTDRETKDKDKINETKWYFVHSSRVVAFAAPQKELGYEGTALSQTFAHLSKLQKQMLQAVFVQCKNLIAGYVVYRAKNKTESTEINKLLSEFSHLTRLGWNGPENDLEQVLKVIVPDFNADQLSQINLLIQKSLANAMNLSIRYLGEEDIASGLGEGGAMVSHEMPIFEIEDMQMHYQRPIEECFYLMGKQDTSLIWNTPNQREEERKMQQKQEELENSTTEIDQGMDNPNKSDNNERTTENGGSQQPE